MAEKNKVDVFFENKDLKWKKELIHLRNIILSTSVDEVLKWGMPTYSVNNKNIVSIVGFKDFFTIWFTQGVFLNDTAKVLYDGKDVKAKGLRKWRFSSYDEIDEQLVIEYIEEAIKNQKEGKKIEYERNNASNFELPNEFVNVLEEDLELKTSFEKLTAGKQKEYSKYIAEAKRVETKIRRINKVIPMIMAGDGLNDKYKNG